MINLIPSIAILKGKVVRLDQGNFDKATYYHESPLDIALRFEEMGIKTVHLLDLEGARRGDPMNYHILEMLKGYTKLKVDFTGGIYTDGAAGKSFECGADTITVGTLAVKNRDLFHSWLITYGRDKIILSADAINHKVAIHGWQRETDIKLYDHIEYNYMRGLQYVKSTDISKEGSLAGPAIDLYKDIKWKFPDLKLIASGGVRNMDDIKKLQEIGVDSVIFGKAYYEKQITDKDLSEFLKASA